MFNETDFKQKLLKGIEIKQWEELIKDLNFEGIVKHLNAKKSTTESKDTDDIKELIQSIRNAFNLFNKYNDVMKNSSEEEFLTNNMKKLYTKTIEYFRRYNYNNQGQIKELINALGKKGNDMKAILERLYQNLSKLEGFQYLFQQQKERNKRRSIKNIKEGILNPLKVEFIKNLENFSRSPHTFDFRQHKYLKNLESLNRKQVKEKYEIPANNNAYNGKINILLERLGRNYQLECKKIKGKNNLFNCKNKSKLFVNSKNTTHYCKPQPNSNYYTCNSNSNKKVRINIK